MWTLVPTYLLNEAPHPRFLFETPPALAPIFFKGAFDLDGRMSVPEQRSIRWPSAAEYSSNFATLLAAQQSPTELDPLDADLPIQAPLHHDALCGHTLHHNTDALLCCDTAHRTDALSAVVTLHHTPRLPHSILHHHCYTAPPTPRHISLCLQQYLDLAVLLQHFN